MTTKLAKRMALGTGKYQTLIFRMEKRFIGTSIGG
jgi:hypothetical protein